ncbi:Zn(II)2Cys6 transcription factor [Aspergillus clavatus NRRL 1]|uniref:C6 transcription factor, putative n=1 Tax=Aspergillus clavatus (strain ATCC 1007 / CBS 513.65 / DSM 816 / NCTC 3887 / NRRL 1 / QM 1276 / 107) TaxID=344612 RepID=A1CNB1_ASPCL|nr:C6 transcription factor, putative [Aspergillus clavatus NRRL 1]EAW07132.1 C6 transcription factor, putative [Aspergillus clavatus NRRL 1]
MPVTRQSVTKRACDGCKVRKIRCGGSQPCQACKNSKIQCTYNRVQQLRGPRNLRATTKHLIEQTQRGLEAQSDAVPSVAASGRTNSQKISRIPTEVLSSTLYIYQARMYPIWPIVNIQHLVSILQNNSEGADLNAYALATAIAAATLAQLMVENTSGKLFTADTFAAECLRARNSCGYRPKPSIDSVRTSFFLHAYYENQQPGGSESLLYLREAITLAQMMRMHQEASYQDLNGEEQQIRRRVLWLLFVTERGICVIHKLPVMLRTTISTHGLHVNDEPQVLPAFLKLLNLFRLFEKSRMFDIIGGDTVDGQLNSNDLNKPDEGLLKLLQGGQQDGTLGLTSDVQKADIYVTKNWMRMLLWKVLSKNKTATLSASWSISPSFPVIVAKELLNMLSQLPRPAMEAHGLGMELKLHEIANSLADAVLNMATLPRALIWDGENRPSHILAKLHSLLSTFRGGGNKRLVELLWQKMAHAQSVGDLILPTSIGTPLMADSQHLNLVENSSDDRITAIGGVALPQYENNHSAEMVTITDWSSLEGLQGNDYNAPPLDNSDSLCQTFFEDLISGTASNTTYAACVAPDLDFASTWLESFVVPDGTGQMASFTPLGPWQLHSGGATFEDCSSLFTNAVGGETSFEDPNAASEDLIIQQDTIAGS